MIELLVKIFVKNSNNTENPHVRESYCVLAGTIGIICNLGLFLIKLMAGAVMGSIAVISDAFNNLSDMGASVVSIIGARLSNMKPDREHPFGHGRIEYISSLIVSFIIMLVGFELIKTSVGKIFQPEMNTFNPWMTGVLIISVVVKFWMYAYNKHLGKKINSGVLLVASRDSINDAIATSAVILTTIIGRYVKFPQLDGIVGTLISVIIMYSGFQIARDTIGVLLGTPPKQETILCIQNHIMSAEGIVGIHDLVVHDYGPGRVLASVHAEVPDDYDIVRIHEIIDDLERKIEREAGIHMVIHMDPISVNCEITNRTKEIVVAAIKEIDEKMNIHDFRMTDGVENINLIFDVEVPFEYENIENLPRIIGDKMRSIDSRYSVVVNIDRMYADINHTKK